MTKQKLTTKEMRAELKALVKQMAADQRERRQAKYEAMDEAKKTPPWPDGWQDTRYWETDWFKAQQRVNNLHWKRHGYREDNRALLLAYGYFKGRTYRQVENKTRPGNGPMEGEWRDLAVSANDYLLKWEGWDDAGVDVRDWVDAETKTRYQLEAETGAAEAA